MKVKVLVAQLHLTLWDPMDCSPPGSCAHGISWARILEWVSSILQGILLTQESNLGLLHYRQILYCLSHQGILILYLATLINSLFNSNIFADTF